MLELRRRSNGKRHTIEVALNSIGAGHPFEISYQAKKAAKWFNSDRVVILVKFFLVCALIVAFLLILSAFFSVSGRAQTPASVPTFAPIVHIQPTATPITIQTTITADSINAAMPADSQTTVLSVEPAPILPAQRAAIDGQVVITSGLIGAGFWGWTDDRNAGDLSFSCNDLQCGQYDPNRVYYLCGGWSGINGDKLKPVLSVIKSVHVCIEAQRIPLSNSSALATVSQTVRRLLIGDTVLWPILYIEVYADRSPYPVASLGK